MNGSTGAARWMGAFAGEVLAELPEAEVRFANALRGAVAATVSLIEGGEVFSFDRLFDRQAMEGMIAAASAGVITANHAVQQIRAAIAAKGTVD